MARIERFEDIEAWQKARRLTKSIYQMTAQGGFSRDYALINQIRRAAVSVVGNIAEGFERGGDKEFVQFLATAKGSCGEVRSYLYVALDLGYIDGAHHEQACKSAAEISRMIAGLMRHLTGSPLRGSKYKDSPKSRPGAGASPGTPGASASL